MGQQLAIVLVGVGGVLVLGILMLIARTWRQVDQGRAMIVNKMGSEPKVTFTGAIVLPIVNKAEVMDLSVKTIDVSRRGKEGLICADNIRADINVTFFVRVNKTVDDVLRVAQSIGCIRASQQATLEELFAAKFSEALKTVGKKMEFEQLYTQRDVFKDQIIQVIGKDLNGYVLDDAAIDYLEQTPVEVLDPTNVLDSLGIRKITEITTGANIDTNQLKQRERMELGRQNLTAQEALFRFEQAQAEAQARKDKEVAVANAREQNLAHRFALEEGKRTQIEKQRADEAIQMAEQAKLRAVQVSEQGRIREVEVEKVRVAKAHDLEDVVRRREVELGTIDMNKAVETEKRSIADIIRARIAVDKTVAVEEESIKDLRNDAEARRHKQVTVIHAEAAMEATDREARAAIRRAEGAQAQRAADGLAQVQIHEAEAVVLEKRMLAEARGLHEKAAAMRALEGVPREHEEFRLRLEADRAIALEQVKARVQIAEQQAKVMAETMGNADIKIIGGDGQFFDRFIKAVSLGSSIDGVLDSSATVRQAVGDKLLGNGPPAASPAAARPTDATLAAVLGGLMASKVS